MRLSRGFLCALALVSTVGIVVRTRDVMGLEAFWSSRNVYGVSGLLKMFQSHTPDLALLSAVVDNDSTGVQLALDAGANPNTQYWKVTPLLIASADGFVNVVQALLDGGADVQFVDGQGNTALHSAAWNGHAEIVSLLLENGAEHSFENHLGETPLFRASIHGDAESAKQLVDTGANPSHRDGHGWTPLHYAVQYGHLALVKLLLEKGANTEIETFEYKSTPMNLAAMAGNGDIIQILVDTGADKNHKNFESYTPLIHAAYLGNQEAIQVLVENDADESMTIEDGLNAGQLLCMCTTASGFEPDCKIGACDHPERMKGLLDF